MIKIGICDSLRVCREELRSLCIGWAEVRDLAVNVVCSKNAGELMHFFTTSLVDFDIVFMDVEFGDIFNGIDAVKEINKICPYCKVIYVSAYSDYATEVYETEHSYFVLKNKDIGTNVYKALDKAYESIEKDKDKIVSVRSNGLRLISIKDIICFERDGRVTIIKTTGDSIRTYETFDEILGKIKSRRIKRCHKSYVVNFFHVAKYSKSKFIMDNGKTIPISRAYQKEIFDCFTDYIDDVLIEPIL